jgi:hypothetical protein
MFDDFRQWDPGVSFEANVARICQAARETLDDWCPLIRWRGGGLCEEVD